MELITFILVSIFGSFGILFLFFLIFCYLVKIHDKAVERDLKGEHKILKGIQSEEY